MKPDLTQYDVITSGKLLPDDCFLSLGDLVPTDMEGKDFGYPGTLKTYYRRKKKPMNTKLNEKIDNLKEAGVCEKGIQAVRELVEEIMGEKLVPAPMPIIKRGDHFRDNKDGSENLLARASYQELVLVDLNGGNSYSDDPVKVIDIYNVSPEEWYQLTAGNPAKFTKIDLP